MSQHTLQSTVTHKITIDCLGPHRVETGQKQLTVAFAGYYIATTTLSAKPLLVWATDKSAPQYYIPVKSLHEDIKARLDELDSDQSEVKKVDEIVRSKPAGPDEGMVRGNVETLEIGEKSLTWVRYLDGIFKGYISPEQDKIGAWFQNGAIFAGIKNPYKRIDTTAVSQHITVSVDGHKVAETNAAVLLNETGHDGTYYLPATSILHWGVIEKSDLKTACPYKGEAWYFSLNLEGKRYENLIWYYQYPTHESAAVEGLISFYNKEGVVIEVDGVVI